MIEKLDGKHKSFIAFTFLAYIVMSIPFTVQGSLAPVTMELYGIDAAQQGLILTMQAVGSLGCALFIGLRGERYNKIHLIALGLVIIGIVGAAIGSAPVYAALLVMAVIMGAGSAFIDILQNSVISDVYPKRKETLLPLLHGFYMMGAMLVPGLVALLATPERPESFVNPFRFLFVSALVVAFFYFLFGQRIKAQTPYINMEAMKKRAHENPAEIFKTKKAWFFIAIGLLYFTFQMGTTMWLPTFTIQNTGAGFTTGGLMLSVFFAGNLVMRFVCPFILKVLSPRIIYSIFGVISGLLMIGALFADNIVLMFVLIAAAGFTQGGSVVTYMLMCIDAFPERSASAASITSLCSGTANLTAPLWMGALSTVTGFLAPMLLITGCLILAAVLIFFFGRAKKEISA